MSIEILIAKKNSLKERVDNHFKNVRMTYETFEKINLYHSIVRDIVGSSYECAGLLLNFRDKYDGICRDALLIRGQHIGPAHVDFDVGAISGSYSRASDNGIKVIGPWHSHGALDVFHSGFDVGHLKAIYIENRLTLPNYIPLGRHYKGFCRNDADLAWTGPEFSLSCDRRDLGKVAELEYKESSRINFEFAKNTPRYFRDTIKWVFSRFLKGIRLSSEQGLAYAQSVTINDNTARCIKDVKTGIEKPVCSMMAIYQKEPSSEEFVVLDERKVDIELVEENNGIILDEDALREEVYDSACIRNIPLRKYNPILKFCEALVKIPKSMCSLNNHGVMRREG